MKTAFLSIGLTVLLGGLLPAAALACLPTDLELPPDPAPETPAESES